MNGFRKWLEAGEVWGVEAPVQRPDYLNNQAFPRYTDEPLPGNKKPMRKFMAKEPRVAARKRA